MTAIKLPSTPRGVTQLLAGTRILLVDDEPDVLLFLDRFLTNVGAKVALACSADEAMVKLTFHRPHVIVSDIAMPGGDGYQLMRRIRARSAADGGATPAIALTAYAGPTHHTRALLAGYQVHLAKPIRAMELVTSIHQLLTRRPT